MNASRCLRLSSTVVFVLLLFAGRPLASGGIYDPLKVTGHGNPEILDLTIHDIDRQREIPVLIYLPMEKTPAPLVIFSHGLGGSRKGCAYLGKHWAARGYVAVFLQHPGSDTGVWQDVPVAQRLAAMQKAAGPENFLLRVKDVSVSLDQLDRWSKSGNHPLAERIDLKRVGMSGHSFGAVTTQAVAGQVFAPDNLSFTDARIKAAIAFSPSTPRSGGDPNQAFGGVKIPWMLMTGTKDTSPIGNSDMASRLAVFPALPPGGKYELVLHGAEHSVFTEHALPGDTEQRNPNHHRAILALSTAFWDAWLGNVAAARTWLDGNSPSSVLEIQDRWQKK